MARFKLCESCEKANEKYRGQHVYIPVGRRVNTAKIMELRGQGKSASEIARAMNCTAAWVYRILREKR